MTNLEKIRTGTDEEVLHLMQRFAYRSLSYTYQELQTEEFLQEECYVNYKGEAIKWRFQRKVKTLTNEQKIRDKISTIEGLADYLVSYNDDYGEFYTSDCESFETKGEAVQHEIEWLKEEYNELW